MKLGSLSRPPDFITRDEIVVEVKKSQSQSTTSNIHFNSSYPKKYFPNPDKENKTALNTVYVIGTLSKENNLEKLWFIYGDCLFAENEIYKYHKKKIKEYIGSAKDKDKQETTKELGRYNEIDPLKITDLRIRGMYHIKHPEKVFDYLLKDIQVEKSKINCFALVLESK
ncbi:MAG: NgoPII family restriction endonuclease [Mollicutes bacterium UO1]